MDTARNQEVDDRDGIRLGRVIRAFVEGGLIMLAFGLVLLVVIAPVAVIVQAIDTAAAAVFGAHLDTMLWQNVISVATVVAVVVLAGVVIGAVVGMLRRRSDFRGPLYE